MTVMNWNRGDAPWNLSLGRRTGRRAERSVAIFVVLMTLCGPAAVRAQTTPPPQQPQQTPPAQQPDQSTPDAGGPGGDNGVIALPKKKEEAPEPPPPPAPKVVNPPGIGNYSLRVGVPVVPVDVGVILQKTHQFVPNLTEPQFRVFED